MIRMAFLGSARWLTGSILAASLLGCAAPHTYMGIDTSPAGTSPLAALARRAEMGDKHAQFELGTAFEKGLGVSADLVRARRLYALAAADSGGSRLMMVPNGSALSAVPTYSGQHAPGLPEARERLKASDSKAPTVSVRWFRINEWEPSTDGCPVFLHKLGRCTELFHHPKIDRITVSTYGDIFSSVNGDKLCRYGACRGRDGSFFASKFCDIGAFQCHRLVAVFIISGSPVAIGLDDPDNSMDFNVYTSKHYASSARFISAIRRSVSE